MYLTQGLHRAVQQQPDAVMTIFGERRRTFREVADRVARLAGALRALGVGDSDRVAMLALNSDRYSEYLLAVPWANAALNPVNFRWSPAEIAYSLRDSGTRVRVVDADDAEVPRGVVGEITCRGGHVMQGYWNKPEETAAALRGGWMHTGDGGYLDEDGYLYVVDRIKDMIISGGENVYSAEVENAVSSHPAVAQCAVIGVPDPGWGERVHAVVVLRPGAALTAEELREHVKALIAGYKAPRSLEVVDALPVSGAGKVLKRDLRAQHWAGAERNIS
jgi:acyl-CoA synthetase (AMP-forming)/AMP-acid ligase II